MIGPISEAAQSDPELDALLKKAREYAAIYLMAKKRQKGCDGMGELAMMKEEFGDAVEHMLRYCAERNYAAAGAGQDLGSLAEELGRL